jgi:hypothetical protein
MVTADFNQDSHPDIMVANVGDGTLNLLLNQGDGTFTVVNPPFSVGTNMSQPVALATADLNKDGLPDIVVANEGDNQVRVLINQGGGIMATQSGQNPLNVGGTQPRSLAIGDINQDGLPDIAVAEMGPVSGSNPPVYRISMIFNLGNGLFQDTGAGDIELPVSLSTPPCDVPVSILLNDTNNDGIPDIVFSCATSNIVAVYLNMGHLNISPYYLPTEGMPGSIAIADVNGDGFGDLVVPCATPANGTVDVFLNKLGVGFEGQSYMSFPANCTGADQVGVADIMSNGHLDIAVGGNGCISLLLNNSN